MKKDLSPLFREFTIAAFRSSGPGGQNVNKTNSAASLRWRVMDSNLFSEEEKTILMMKLRSVLNVDGEVLIKSSTSRHQDENKAECVRKFFALLNKAFFQPKVRKATKPTRSSKEKRHVGKKSRSEIKKMRKKLSYENYD